MLYPSVFDSISVKPNVNFWGGVSMANCMIAISDFMAEIPSTTHIY